MRKDIKRILVIGSIIVFPVGILLFLYLKFSGKKVMNTFDVFDTDDWIGI